MSHMTLVERTDGDGMENTAQSLNEFNSTNNKKVEMHSCKIDFTNLNNLNTTYLTQLKCPAPIRSVRPLSEKKPKTPKFIPYEPYKAAVRPIIPKKKYVAPTLIGLRERELSCSSEPADIIAKDDSVLSSCSISELSEKLAQLRLENEEMEMQLKLQVQVNAELKSLLVAAVGEDIETRVNTLAEDKQHLAQKLINAAKNLSSHNEQVEWLASQCEVWRSKFLASSVMVEELARWKASLSQKIIDGETIIKRILDERKFVRQNLLVLYKNLVALRDNFDLLSQRDNPKTCNVVDLSVECFKISNGLMIQLLGSAPQQTKALPLQELDHYTEGEKAADHMLKHPYLLNLVGEPDAACNAVLGAAVAINSQIYHQINPPRIQCCAKCTGAIQLV